MISAHGRSKWIGIGTFKFLYGDTIIEFDPLIIENSDTPLILSLEDKDELHPR